MPSTLTLLSLRTVYRTRASLVPNTASHDLPCFVTRAKELLGGGKERERGEWGGRPLGEAQGAQAWLLPTLRSKLTPEPSPALCALLAD